MWERTLGWRNPGWIQHQGGQVPADTVIRGAGSPSDTRCVAGRYQGCWQARWYQVGHWRSSAALRLSASRSPWDGQHGVGLGGENAFGRSYYQVINLLEKVTPPCPPTWAGFESPQKERSCLELAGIAFDKCPSFPGTSVAVTTASFFIRGST